MRANTLATVAVTTSAIAIVICLIAAACVLVDVNEFFDDVMKDMDEFKVSVSCGPLSCAGGLASRNNSSFCNP
ncbi:unnamed protein product [Heligmosomoides polygyrus]|uniref:Col_cuticle_N domain-containing protein n=1 Tax=Heligmosomoides polygyrus TaxID=6339 RepID=A0A183GA92_HELPZ|nr:unnamed protein product [Heligmosomoides polygyrus]